MIDHLDLCRSSPTLRDRWPITAAMPLKLSLVAAVVSLLVYTSLLSGSTPIFAHAESQKSGNWSSLDCDIFWAIRDDYPSNRWGFFDTPHAWKDALAGWEEDKKRNDTSFTGSVAHTFGSYAGVDCGSLKKCLVPGTCHPPLSPASTTIMVAFLQVNSVRRDFMLSAFMTAALFERIC